MMIGAPPRDQVAVGIIEVEEPLQLNAGQLPSEPPVRSDLLVAQELHRHASDRIANQETHTVKIVLTANRCSVVPQPRKGVSGRSLDRQRALP